MYIDIPKDVKNIIDIFRENGYEAYAVGRMRARRTS